MAIFAKVTDNNCAIRHSSIVYMPIWLRVQVSKQISCSPISVLISSQRITVLEKPENHPSCTNPEQSETISV